MRRFPRSLFETLVPPRFRLIHENFLLTKIGDQIIKQTARFSLGVAAPVTYEIARNYPLHKAGYCFRSSLKLNRMSSNENQCTLDGQPVLKHLPKLAPELLSKSELQHLSRLELHAETV